MKTFVHPTAIVEEGAQIGVGTKVWHHSHIRQTAKVGNDCSLGKDVYIDKNVVIGNGCRVQNGTSIYEGVDLGQSCFVGPHVVFTNDRYPRSGSLNWKLEKTRLNDGCSIGAGAIILCGIELGAFSMIGAGTLVNRSIAPFQLVTGFPARPRAAICACGESLFSLEDGSPGISNCCRQKLNPEVLQLAATWVLKLGRSEFQLTCPQTDVSSL